MTRVQYGVDRPRGGLGRDQRGAVLLLGVFLSVFAVAMLYYVVGIGAAVWAREGLQDSADAGAFSAAILHARGMNLIAFINIVMAALVAVLVACRVVQGLCVLGIVIATALASTTFGASLAAVAPLKSTMVGFQNAHQGLKPAVLGTVGVLHKAQWMISYAVPPVAVIDSVLEASRHHPPARFGVALPGGVRLPVEADRFEVLCERATMTVADLVLFPLDRMGLGPVTGPIKRAGASLAGSASSFFCGAGGGSPPAYERREDVRYPRSASTRRCEQEAKDPNGDMPSCDRAEHELHAARPADDGSCRPDQNCSLQGEYVQHMREARQQCEPRAGFSANSYTWQERKVHVEYTYRRDRGWVQTDVRRGPPRLHEDAFLAPCGDQPGALGPEWNLEPYPTGNVADVRPLCAEEHEVPTGESADGDRATVDYREASQLIGCVRAEVRRDEPFAGGEPIRGGAGREPHRMVRDARLGTDRFQLRAVTWGDEPRSAQADGIVALASWGAPSEASSGDLGAHFDGAFQGLGGQVGRLSLAQAEFYYDHDGQEAASEWLWNMKWTARLVRFRLPESSSGAAGEEGPSSPASSGAPAVRSLEDVSSFESVCASANIPRCGDLDQSVVAWERFVLH